GAGWQDLDLEFALDFAKKVNDMSGGDLKIEVLPAGAVDCQRMLIDDWAAAIIGKPVAATPAAPVAAAVRNFRRDGCLIASDGAALTLVFMVFSPLCSTAVLCCYLNRPCSYRPGAA